MGIEFAYCFYRFYEKQYNSKNHGCEILKDDLFEIGTIGKVLGKSYRFEDFDNDSIVLNGVRYVTLDFLYKAKKSWVNGGYARQKDIKDVKLIEKYTSKLKVSALPT